MKKVVLFVVLAMFIAVPVFARGGGSTRIGTSMIIPGSTTLAGFASVATLSQVSAFGPSVLQPLGGGSVTNGGQTSILEPTSFKEYDNTASISSNGAMPAIYPNQGGGVTADSGAITLTATAGANSGGFAAASGTIETYTVAAQNTGLGAAPIMSGATFPRY